MRLETVKARQDNAINSNEPVVAYKDDVYIRDKGFVTGPTATSGTPTAEGNYVPGEKMQAVRNVQKMDEIQEEKKDDEQKVLQERVSSETAEDKTTSKPKSPQDSKSKKIQK